MRITQASTLHVHEGQPPLASVKEFSDVPALVFTHGPGNSLFSLFLHDDKPSHIEALADSLVEASIALNVMAEARRR